MVVESPDDAIPAAPTTTSANLPLHLVLPVRDVSLAAIGDHLPFPLDLDMLRWCRRFEMLDRITVPIATFKMDRTIQSTMLVGPRWPPL